MVCARVSIYMLSYFSRRSRKSWTVVFITGEFIRWFSIFYAPILLHIHREFMVLVKRWEEEKRFRGNLFFLFPHLHGSTSLNQLPLTVNMFFAGCEVSKGLICNPVLSNSFRFSNWYNGHAWWSGVEPHQTKSRVHWKWGNYPLFTRYTTKAVEEILFWDYNALTYFIFPFNPHFFCLSVCFVVPRSHTFCMVKLTTWRYRFD